MALSISSSLIACRQVFNELIDDIKKVGEENPEWLRIQDWEDERGRLRVWAANIGAHQIGQSSLDFRLRDSSHIRQQIVKLLDELFQRLSDGRAIIASGEDSDVESIEDSSSGNEAPQTEVQQLRKSIATIINCLFEMSILVRKPAEHDIRVQLEQRDVTGYEWTHLRHVRDKFTKADEILVYRLASTMDRRRNQLKYRESHAAKLKQSRGHSAQGASKVLSETVTTNTRNWTLGSDGSASDSDHTQTSYASTSMSGNHITIPAPPRASYDGVPFKCPYCYFVIITKSKASWTRHLFQDLQPYVCTEIVCLTPCKLYATRHEWSNHLRVSHPRKVPPQGDTGEQVATRSCALCGNAQTTRDELYERHVARHLQELALFTLPRNNDDPEEGKSLGVLGARSGHASPRDQLGHNENDSPSNSGTSADEWEYPPGKAVVERGSSIRWTQHRRGNDM
ncbi:MAG: hypothetical protein L6R39_000934 [Caloplaca ligustica]|nr:MAG: hypothetical protein L6R39_000934 [Caloplaca ligustica]